MRKIGLVVAGLTLATAGTGAWASSANAGEPAKAMADSCCIGRDGVISKASCVLFFIGIRARDCRECQRNRKNKAHSDHVTLL